MRASLATAVLLLGCTHTPLKLTVTTAEPRVVWPFAASVPTFIAHLRNRSAETAHVSSLDVHVTSLVCDGKRILPGRCADVLSGAHDEDRDLAPGEETSFTLDIRYASVAGWSECFLLSPPVQTCEATFIYESRGHSGIRGALSNRVRFDSVIAPRPPRRPRPDVPAYPGEPAAP